MVLKVLDEVASLHPFIATTVKTFELVVTLDLKRRENNKKVLRDVQDPYEMSPDGKTLTGRLQSLMEEIPQYINECASGCDLYLKKSPISLSQHPQKYLKSSIYESRLAEYANRFSEFETKIGYALAVHTARNVDDVRKKLDEQGFVLLDIRSQMRELFLRQDTPREKEMRRIIERGGAKPCIGNDKELKALVDMSPEDSEKADFKLRPEIALENLRKGLLKELAEDIDTALQQNLVLFNSKLDLQQRELQGLHAAIAITEGRIMAALSRDGHQYIIDSEIREIWAEM
ncbi:hypothetical protein H0H92_008207, partial [Tricholoma furcatifolium]